MNVVCTNNGIKVELVEQGRGLTREVEWHVCRLIGGMSHEV